MNFAVTANANGPADPNNRVLRGADPLYLLPAGHALRRSVALGEFVATIVEINV